MDDQFSEWDRFYAAWERTSNASRAMNSYKKERLGIKKDPEEKKRKKLAARLRRIEKLRSTIVRRWEMRFVIRAKQEQDRLSSQTSK